MFLHDPAKQRQLIFELCNCGCRVQHSETRDSTLPQIVINEITVRENCEKYPEVGDYIGRFKIVHVKDLDGEQNEDEYWTGLNLCYQGQLCHEIHLIEETVEFEPVTFHYAVWLAEQTESEKKTAKEDENLSIEELEERIAHLEALMAEKENEDSERLGRITKERQEESSLDALLDQKAEERLTRQGEI